MIINLQVIEIYSIIFSHQKNSLMCSNFIFYDLMRNKIRNSSAIILSIITLTLVSVFVFTNMPQASADTVTLTFSTTFDGNVYTEKGVTITNLSTRSPHMHVRGDLTAHLGTSQPYKFDLGGKPFTLVQIFASTLRGSNTFVSSSGASQSLGPGDSLVIPFGSGFDRITSFTWSTSFLGSIDNVVISFEKPASIHGMKWNDLNGNGLKDPGEPGIPGWKIDIECQTSSASTTTDDIGNYWFINIPTPNECTVSEEIRPDWTPTTPTKVDVSVGPGDIVEGVNFGNWQPASIHGMKWNDLNGNGLKDPGEPGISGWKIDVECQDFSASTATDDIGNYWFINIPTPNECTVSEEIRPEWHPTTPTKVDVSFRPGDGVEDLNFGNRVQSLFIVIDEDSIDNGNPPNFFEEGDVNDGIAAIGLRTPLPAFSGANIGSTITLHTGEVGDEGWFALKTIPDSWNTAGPTTDGLTNFFLAGPGLGTPDMNGDRESQLDKIPDVTPLRATNLSSLVGENLCAVVYDSDVSIDYDKLEGSLKGDNLGIVAFTLNSVTQLTEFSSSSLPEVEVDILDASLFCKGFFELHTEAIEPDSSSEPPDVIP